MELSSSHTFSRMGAAWLPAAYWLFFSTLPFMVYKNYQYLAYISSHGGYLVVFTDNAAVLASAGSVVRVLSFLANNTFLILFIMERRRSRLVPLTILFSELPWWS